MAGRHPRLVLFARFPAAGKVKTRLIPALGAEGAAALHRRLVLRTLRTAHSACLAANADLEIRYEGGSQAALRHWLGDGWVVRPQINGDLGQRMANAFEESIREGSPATIIIGSDCPNLTPRLLAGAFNALSERAAVFGPAMDGGYYLVGLSRMVPELFQGIAWGTDSVLAESRRVLSMRGLEPALLEPLDDLDRPEDLRVWRRIVEHEDANPTRISVIIPALNEASHIGQTLAVARQGGPHELLVVDGGSADSTRELALRVGAKVLVSRPGRSRQMNLGAARASGSVLLFLHADTLLPSNWPRTVARILQRPGVAAGAFAFGVVEGFAGKRLLEWGANLRSRRLQTPYGDQALFLRRSLFDELGGFADLPIMEDYEFARRLRRSGEVVTAAEAAITSGRRWTRLGFFRATLINQIVIAGFHLGVRPKRLAAWYRGL